ncbi:R3H-associated N-terminal domain-containing protein [Trichoderma sp. SZMC 28014]
MAIYSAVPPPPESPPNQATANSIFPATAAPNSAIDIEAWTISALQSLSVSPIARGTGSPLTIPLDALATPSKRSISRQQVTIVTSSTEAALVTPLRRPPSARDSQKRREAILKGKEGSRQRRRWENDRLVDVPNVQPPEPIDWEVHPTHPIHRVPYQLAQFWDHGVRQRIQDKTAKLQAARKKQQLKAGSATGLGMGEVPRDLRESTKRSPVVRTWVKALEEPVRQYMDNERQRQRAEEQQRQAGNGRDEDVDSAAEEMDSDDEEIVFVGRNGRMRDMQQKRAATAAAQYRMAHREVSQETVDSGLLFDSFGDDSETAAFKRWLTHAIADYYGLTSRSVTLANSQRVVYVGLKQAPRLQKAAAPLVQMPRPLWEIC